MASVRGLGRGLESLIPAGVKTERSTQAQVVPVSHIRANRYQPRSRFDEERLKELADSIREQGLIQPLVVSPLEGGADGQGGEVYELLAGERRLRAAKMAGLGEVPVVVKKASDREKLQISLIENIQREDLNPVEEARAFQRFMQEFQLTQEELSKVLGKGRVVIANTLRLLNLPQSILDAVSDGTISAGHARNLVSISDEKLQRELAEKILAEHLTVRQVERLVSDWKGAIGSGRVKVRPRKDPEIRELEESLQKTLGTQVEITARGKGKSAKGWIRIAYYSLDDFERILKHLRKK